MSFDDIAEHLRKIPELEGRIGNDSGVVPTLPRFGTEEAIEVFGDLARGRPMEQTVVDTAKQLLNLEK